ncbi:MAG: hypothetical protein GC160_08540 [Acidobacteria bacterium]|nr:hypothetical protein [Acidobacteriota bacterium]
MVDFSQIAALLRLQKQTVANAFRQHSERHGLWASIALSILWYGLWGGAAAIAAMTPNMIGVEDVETALPGVLLFIMGYWQLSPLVTLSLGISLDMRKLALYPTSVPTLFVVECLLRIWSGFEMILILAGLWLGLVTAGTAQPWRLTLAFALFVAFNVLFSAGMRNLIERVFQKRVLREIVLILMVSLTVLPQMLAFSEKARDLASSAVKNEVDVPYWLFPSGLAARIAVSQSSVGDWALLLAMLAASAVFGYGFFRSSCRLTSASTAGEQAPPMRGARKSLTLMQWLARLPSRAFPDPLGVLMEKEIKYLWRSPRFRLPFFMGFTFGVIAWVPIMLRMKGPVGEWMQQSAATFITLYALLLLGPVLFLNRFGFDRGATRFYFWMPLRFEELLLAKNLATAVYGYFEMSLVATVCWVIGLPVGWRQIVEAVVVTTVALFYLMTVGNHMSVRFPIPSNPDRVSRAGASHGLRAAVQFLLFPLSLSPILLAFGWRYVGESPHGFFWMMLAAGVLGVMLYTAAFLNAAGYGQRRRETLIGFLSTGEGPLAAE